jgi:hypothetical protein
VSAWKVILATLAIFSAGLVIGGLGVRQLLQPAQQETIRRAGPMPVPLRNEYIQNLGRELRMSDQQRGAVSNVVQQSQDRVRHLHDRIAPDVRDEVRRTRQEIRALLTPEQQRQFDELPRRRLRRGDRQEQRRERSN